LVEVIEMPDDMGLEEVSYIPARKLEKPKEQPKQGIASKVIGTAKGVGGYVKREVQGEIQAGKNIASASPRLAGNALISGAKEAKAGTEVAGWVAGKEIGFREWQAKRAEAKARLAQAQVMELQTHVSVEKARFDLTRLREAEATVRRRDAENARRANVISGLTFGGGRQQEANPFAIRHPLESMPIGSLHSSFLGGQPKAHKARTKHHKKSHSKTRKISFTDSSGKKVSFNVKK
jgi:hypothetical protein